MAALATAVVSVIVPVVMGVVVIVVVSTVSEVVVSLTISMRLVLYVVVLVEVVRLGGRRIFLGRVHVGCGMVVRWSSCVLGDRGNGWGVRGRGIADGLCVPDWEQGGAWIGGQIGSTEFGLDGTWSERRPNVADGSSDQGAQRSGEDAEVDIAVVQLGDEEHRHTVGDDPHVLFGIDLDVSGEDQFHIITVDDSMVFRAVRERRMPASDGVLVNQVE